MELNRLSQKEIVLNHLIEHGSITTIECYDKYRITDLAHAIMLLRKDRFPITDRWEIPKKRKGYARKYKRYFLGECE